MKVNPPGPSDTGCCVCRDRDGRRPRANLAPCGHLRVDGYANANGESRGIGFLAQASGNALRNALDHAGIGLEQKNRKFIAALACSYIADAARLGHDPRETL